MEKTRNMLLNYMGVTLSVFFLAISGFYYYQYEQTKTQLETLKQNTKTTNTKDLIDKVSNLTVLPKDEVPTVATITNIEDLKNVSFFKLAQNGDKLLIYTKAKRTIIYRESSNQIVETMTTAFDISNKPEKQVSDQVAGAQDMQVNKKIPYTLTVLNGTQVVGQAEAFGDKLAERDVKYIVSEITKDDAKLLYDNSIAVGLSTLGKSIVNEIFVDIKSELLPSAEILPQTDVVIIVGSDIQTINSN